MTSWNHQKNEFKTLPSTFRCIGTVLLVVLCGCSSEYQESSIVDSIKVTQVRSQALQPQLNGPIQPLALPVGLDKEKVALGRKLFHDKRLSHDNTISCASCHNLSSGGVDSRKFAIGIDGQVGQLNTPTVFNSSFYVAQFWDGRAKSLEEQVSGPVHNPIEMGSTWDEVVTKLRDDKDLTKKFRDIYGRLTSDAIVDAIATFERSLVTVDSPFDQYLLGDEEAISEHAKQGYELFVNIGCTSCHQGQAIGGNLFQKFGVMKEYYHEDMVTTRSDRGRLNVTDREVDLHRFKVPSLRNIEQTAPYFHNGSVKTLEEAVQIMAEHQLGMSLDEEEVFALIEFLESLNGKIPEEI